jgi:hypothetical protein
MGDRAAEDEAARLDAGDLVGAPSREGLDQFVDGAPERARVAEQRRDVPEHDPVARVVESSEWRA